MILVDTSVWINHFRRPIAHLRNLIELKDAWSHPLVVGELMMGGLPDRQMTLRALQKMPAVSQALHAEVVAFVEWQKLSGTRIGFIDAHLLAATTFTDGCKFWTSDRKLFAQAKRLGVAYVP